MKLPRWAAIVLVMSLLLNIKTTLDISSMKSEIRNLRSNVNSINSSINNTMSSGISSIERILKKEASIVNEFKYEIIGIKDKKADYMLCKTKIYNEGEDLFSHKRGKTVLSLFQRDEDNISFIASTSISILDGANIDLVMEGQMIENRKARYNLSHCTSLLQG